MKYLHVQRFNLLILHHAINQSYSLKSFSKDFFADRNEFAYICNPF